MKLHDLFESQVKKLITDEQLHQALAKYYADKAAINICKVPSYGPALIGDTSDGPLFLVLYPGEIHVFYLGGGGQGTSPKSFPDTEEGYDEALKYFKRHARTLGIVESRMKDLYYDLTSRNVPKDQWPKFDGSDKKDPRAFLQRYVKPGRTRQQVEAEWKKALEVATNKVGRDSPKLFAYATSVLKTALHEAAYSGNLGMMEMFKFYQTATPEQKTKMKDLLDSKLFKEAWEFLQQVTGIKLVPPGEELR